MSDSQGSNCSNDIKIIEQVHERIQEVSGSEGINEQAIHGESELKETQKVSAEDYALEKVMFH